MIWLVPICLALYVTLTATFLQMADPLNKANHIDRYGRTGREGRKQLVSGRSHYGAAALVQRGNGRPQLPYKDSVFGHVRLI